MDYENIAKELLGIHMKLSHVPANEMMDRFIRGELFVLGYLMTHDEKAYPKDLSKAMGVSSARIAALVNQTEKKGWVTRSEDLNDSRKTVITLTDAGRQEVEETREKIIAEVVRMLKSIGLEDSKELLRIDRKIVNL